MKTLADFKSLEQNCEEMHITCPTTPLLRERLRHCIINIKKPWAKTILHVDFNWECLDKNCGYCAFHSSAEIAGERGDNNE